MRRTLILLPALILLLAPAPGRAAGTLTPVGSSYAPIQNREHQVDVVINNGFAMTEVHQTFFNPNDADLEALFTLPLPKSASLSEMTIFIGEREIHGEVLEKSRAEQIYEEEKDRGNDAGLASKNGIQSFEFRVFPVRAQDETRIRFVYYQPLDIDTGIGRFVYPLEEGGTDEAARSFWLRNSQVEGSLRLRAEIKSAWPITDVRVPGFDAEAVVTLLGPDHYEVVLDRPGAALDRDFVVYYRLEDDLPGRVEVVAYRGDPGRPGTFMAVLTPGPDLQPLVNGVDYVFVLDVSGSMEGKIRMLAEGVAEALGNLRGDDRFRIVVFDDRAERLTRGWQPATPDNVADAIAKVRRLRAGSGTNLYDGLSLGLDELDDDRATSLILVTDAVTNTGVVEPIEFRRLMQAFDVRIFGFLMGNSGNWPLMRLICDTTGGFYAQVSNEDDIFGQILQAKSKMTHEALHDASLKVTGGGAHDVTGELVGKLYRGQQLVLFGRYDKPGPAKIRLDASLTGIDQSYETTFDLPELDTENPELERLWALARIEEIETMVDAGLMPEPEGDRTITDLGVEYQIVTDQTSMVVLSDESFAERGIDRRNQRRVERERQAQAVRLSQPAQSRRVDDTKPMFGGRKAPSLGGGGGGAFDPLTGLLALGLGALGLASRRRRSGGA